MDVNLLPLASLLDQYRCTLRIDLVGSAIRQGLRPHHVACSNGCVAVDLHLKIAGLRIGLKTSIKLGLEVVPFVFKRVGSAKEFAAHKASVSWQVVLHDGARIPAPPVPRNAPSLMPSRHPRHPP